jgi:hypothetical protein
MAIPFGELRALIETEHLPWQPSSDRATDENVPRHSLGASADGLMPTAEAAAFELASVGIVTTPSTAFRGGGHPFLIIG